MCLSQVRKQGNKPSCAQLTWELGGTRGMGEAMVHKFLQEEANVSYCARTVTNTEYDDFYPTLAEGNTARAVGTAFDVASKDALVKWVESSAERLGRIDVIIANGDCSP